MQSVADRYPTVDVLDRDEFREEVSSTIDQFLAVITALLALAVLIALLGVANTLSLAIFERTREIGLLRAVGMTRSQLRTTIRNEAMIVALLGTTLGGGESPAVSAIDRSVSRRVDAHPLTTSIKS